jgi:hypothetical protein
MQILDLEEADFIQYKPADVNWPKPEEFVVVNVKRDPEWWKTYLPVMREFWDRGSVLQRASGRDSESQRRR